MKTGMIQKTRMMECTLGDKKKKPDHLKKTGEKRGAPEKLKGVTPKKKSRIDSTEQKKSGDKRTPPKKTPPPR